MKSAGLFLLLPAGFALTCGAAEPAKPRLSERIRKEIVVKLPAYLPKQAAISTDAPLSEPNPDPGLFVLPKVIVNEKRLPGNDPDVWLTEKVIQQKAMVAYKTSMTDFEWALNSWFIPLITPPASVRARYAYRAAKVAAEMDRLSNVIRAIGVNDPKEAARLKRELTRPPGSLPSKDR